MEFGRKMMTTESRPKAEERDQLEEAAIKETLAEGRRNRERWQRDWKSIRDKHPSHWIAIYDGGQTVVAHEDAQAHFDHLFQLEGLNRSTVFRWPPPPKPNTHRITSAFRRRAT